MSNSSERNNGSNNLPQNEIKTLNEQKSRVGEQSTELGSNLKNYLIIYISFSWN